MNNLRLDLIRANFVAQLINGGKFLHVGESSDVNEIGISVLKNVFCIESVASGYLIYRPVCGAKAEKTWCFHSSQEVVDFLNEQSR